jgi:DNA-binding response OmpR family regulator
MTLRILCIEDEPELLDDLLGELDDAGYLPTGASDGFDGLEKALSGRFDLVLSDVQLPGIMGLEILRRARPVTDAPFIMLTAFGDRPLREQCIELGAQATLLKPVDYDELLGLIESIAQGRQA